MGNTITTYMSSGSDWDGRDAGDGLCVFFYDGGSEFYPGGIGSSLGYTNYRGPLCYHADTFSDAPWSLATPSNSATDINGIKGAYVGVGFDVRGNFSNTTDGKLGNNQGTVTTYSGADKVATNEITQAYPNTIAVRLSEAQYYKLHSVSDNLSVFPVASADRYKHTPPVNLHQTVATKDDVVYTTARVTLQNKGKRVLVEIKDAATGKFYTYHVADLTSGFESVSNPDTVKAGISFSTSDAFMNCDIRNFTVQGSIIDKPKESTKLRPTDGHSFYVDAS